MSGSALTTFNDFVKSTGPSFLTDARSVVNEAQKQSYLLRRFLRGNDMSKVLQGGRVIRDEVMFDESNTFEYVLPNATHTWQNPQVLTEHEINWRFAVDHMAWTDQEVELNVTDGMTSTARHAMYKHIKYVKEQRCATSQINGMEDQLFTLPVAANMEASGGKEPYSIPAFVNEEANGLHGQVAGTAWTVVEGIDPTVETRWVPQTESYDDVTTTPAGNADNILTAFDSMFYKVRFVTPPTKQEYFENDSLFTQFIACSRRGMNEYQQLLRESQDLFATTSRQDPAYLNPAYGGIDLQYVTTLDTAALYADNAGTAYTTEVTAANGNGNGPRYYWLNGKYLCPVFHTKRYWYKHDPLRHPNQHNTWVCPVDTWYNLVCRSRQRLGIVEPLADEYQS